MKIKSLFVAAMAVVSLAGFAPVANSAESIVTEGVDYVAVAGAKAGKKAEVYEFFSYTCPHCFTMEGFLEQWKKEKPEEVKFTAIPVYMESMKHLTYAYYAAEALKVLDKVHPLAFNQWHVKKQIIRTKADFVPIFAAAGVSEADFEKAYNSATVKMKVDRAKSLAIKFQITSFPQFVVNRKYKVKSYKNLPYMLSEFPVQQVK